MLVKLHRSRFVGVVMLLTHLSALAVFYWIDLAVWARLLLILAVLASLVDVFRYFVLRLADKAITMIELDSDGNIKLGYRNGVHTHVSRLRSVFVSPVITLVTAKTEDSRFARKIVIPFDAIEPDVFRQLRVKLKQGRLS